MGQRSYELLNKTPNYIFWNSMWNSSFCFKNNLYLDFFFKKLLNSIFLFNTSSFFFKNLNNKNNSYLYKTTNLFLEKNTEYFNKSMDYLNPYLSKIWLLSYKNWIFLTFFIFYPKGKVAIEDSVIFDDATIDFYFYINNKKKNFNVNNF
jgi:hypothetical protein